MSGLRDLVTLGLAGLFLYQLLSSDSGRKWINENTKTSWWENRQPLKDNDQVKNIAITVTVVYLVMFALSTFTSMVRTAFKLSLFLSIIVYLFMFHGDIIAKYIPGLRKIQYSTFGVNAFPQVKKVLRLGVTALADRLYDLAKLLR